MNNNLEELITALYDMIQDAKSVPLSSDKCFLERDKALDLLDELSEQLPAELKQARTIVASREELIVQARGEAKKIITDAQAEAAKLVEQETIYQQTLAKCQEMAKANMEECEERIRKTEETMEQIKAASFGYVDNSLRQTEETILKALNEVKDTRAKFQNITQPASVVDNTQYDQEL
ncbi:MAG: hypothetical protein IKD27_03195 [Oscillospiraceae bacterium]|nr:hypothetical protein [Oscillospiraceae bacterium]